MGEHPVLTVKLCWTPAPNARQPGAAHFGCAAGAAIAQVELISAAATPTDTTRRRRDISAAGLDEELA
jgi:hypothetical protein